MGALPSLELSELLDELSAVELLDLQLTEASQEEEVEDSLSLEPSPQGAHRRNQNDKKKQSASILLNSDHPQRNANKEDPT